MKLKAKNSTAGLFQPSAQTNHSH